MTIIHVPKELNFLAPIQMNDLIRVGNTHDGGYVAPREIICKSNFLLSFGLNDDWTFEQDFINYVPSATIHVYDHSVSKKFFLNKFKKTFFRVLRGKFFYTHQLIKDWNLYQSYISFFKNNHQHFVNRISDHNHTSLDVNISSILEKINSYNIFLKMDIEGSEYRIIRHLTSFSDKILGMVIEFHDTDPLRLTFIQSIQQLQSNYSIVHIHPNNHAPIAKDGLPESLEITLVRNDFIPNPITYRYKLLLNTIDSPCNPLLPEYSLIFSP